MREIGKFDGVADFLEVIAQIRDPKTGCPWDLAQTHESLLKYFAEEVQEFIDAMRQDGPAHPHTWEELGDVMLQVGLHTHMAEEKGLTNFNQVCAKAAEKLRLRHPHVFDPNFPKFKTPEEVSAAWEQIKAWAKQKQNEAESVASSPEPPDTQPKSAQLDAIPLGLSPMLRAQRIGEKAAAFRFDWPDSATVMDKVLEETQELVAALDLGPKAQKEEFGDLMFTLAQYARKRGWDPDELTAQANQKFCGRFRKMESYIASRGLRWEDLSLAQLEESWQAIKALTLYH